MTDRSSLVGLLPHRPPMLMLQGAEPAGERALVAYQTIPSSGPFVEGHFPGFAVWPGVLLVEAMAQATALCLLGGRTLQEGEVPILGAVDCRFLHPVFPGDELRIHAELIRCIGNLGLFTVRVERGVEVVARGRITAGFTRRVTLARGGS